ncbi:MAG TPA: hypothetical protein VNO17_02130 [Actinomycetota bacterium]|nr:hypothetical protein [Actinomycetota bacterium]
MKAEWKRRHGVLAGVFVGGVGVGLLLLLALPVVGGPRFTLSQPRPQLPDPSTELAAAEAAAPYDMRLPTSLPAGAALEHVIWDVDTGGVVVVDVWFSLPGAGRLHIWQTNTSSAIQSIPEGEAVAVGERQWSQVMVDWGGERLLQLSSRFDDGVTVTVDAPLNALDAQGLVQVAASLA